jgi:hypothetical protein
MVVINLNEHTIENKMWILTPYSHWKTENNVKLLLEWIYIAQQTMSNTKMGLLSK